MIRTTFALLCLATPAFADRIEAEASCTQTQSDLHYHCNIALSSSGNPVSGVTFTVSLAMPSMPMAHNIPPVEATESETPGTYSTDLHLDMPGDWILTLELSAPRRDRVVLSHSFD